MAKKKSTKSPRTKHLSVSPTHFMIKRSLISYVVLVFIAFTAVSMSAYLLERMATARIQHDRVDRITSIYNKLDLGESYKVAHADIFGDKRVYDWDKSRTYASSTEYGHNDTVSNTFADLKKKIEAAGFTQFETAYAGSLSQQYHFKDDKGEYIRVSVVTKATQDMLVYGTPTLTEWNAISDKNAAPSYVTIKVNLDDNNE